MLWASSHKYGPGKRKCDYSDKKEKEKSNSAEQFSLSDPQTYREDKWDTSADLKNKWTKRKL